MAIANADGSIVLTTKVDQSGLKKGMTTMKSGVSSLIGSFSKLATAIGLAFSVGALVKFSKEASNLATTAEASVQRLIDIYGSASQAVGDFIDANAQALGMSRAAAASYASVYGNLFSVWADQQTNAALTNQYLQMTAVVASKTGRTVADVQERIRSGLLGNTEAIEDLGIFVNVKTIEMTDAFQRMADGRSWEQLDAYTQQQIRSMAILEQATAKYGDQVAQTTALTKSQFQAAWQDFQATWGQVINRVLMPVLEILTEILIKATAVTQSLFGISSSTISMGKAIDKATESQKQLTDAVKETEKATKKSLASFDEIQILTSGTNEGAQVKWPNAISGNSSPLTESIIGETSRVDPTPFEQFFAKILTAMTPVVDAFKEWTTTLNFEPMKMALESLILPLQQIGSVSADALYWAYTEILLPLSTWTINKLAPSLVNSLRDGIDGLGKVLRPVGVGFETLYEYMKPMFGWIGDTAVYLIEELGDAFLAVGDVFEGKSPKIEQVFEMIGSAVQKMWHIIEPIFNWMVELVADVFDSLDEMVGGVIDILYDLIYFIAYVFKGDWEEAWNSILRVFKGIINLIVDALNILIRGLNKIKFSFPDWDILGSWRGQSFGIDIPEIPRLAQGAVIPPNREFLAVLGDQKQGTNIEAPLSTIQGAVSAVVNSQNEAMQSTLEQILQAILEIQIGDDVIGRASQRYNNRMIKIYGG